MNWLNQLEELLGDAFVKKEELQSRRKKLNDHISRANIRSTLHPHDNAVFVRDAPAQDIQVRLFYSDSDLDPEVVGRNLTAVGDFFRASPSIQIAIAGPLTGNQLHVLCCFSRKMMDQQVLTIGGRNHVTIEQHHVETLLEELINSPRDELTDEKIAQVCSGITRTVIRDTIQEQLDRARRRYIKQIDKIRGSYPEHTDLVNDLCKQYSSAISLTPVPKSDDADSTTSVHPAVVQGTTSSDQADETTSHQVTMHDLVKAGLITEGEEIVWYRRNKGVTYRASVLASGSIRLSDGRECDSLTRAAYMASDGARVHGWKVWKTSSSKPLDDLRDHYLATKDGHTQSLHTDEALARPTAISSRDTDSTAETPISSTAETSTPKEASAAPASPQNKKRVTVLDLLGAGLLSAGDRIRWDRPRKKESFEATVCDSGDIELSDGRTFTSLSAAAVAASGLQTADGWLLWCTTDGRRLHELRSEFEQTADDRTKE